MKPPKRWSLEEAMGSDLVETPAPSPNVAAPAAPVRDMSQPRNMRNNNPGNIEDGPYAQSLPGYVGSDGRFAIFDNPEAGTDAKVRLLQSYGERGFNTPNSIIGRWAPASDNNDVPAYAGFVSRKLGVNPDDPLDMTDPQILSTLAGAIQEFEGGPAMAAAQAGGSPQRWSLEDALGEGAPAPAPAVTPPTSAGRMGGGFIDAETREALQPAQLKTYSDLAAAGELDPNARPGSAKFPLAQRNPNDLPKPGDFYVGVDGVMAQVPEAPFNPLGAALAFNPAVGLIDMAAGMAADGDNLGAKIQAAIPRDPRAEALKNALGSGFLLGGQNELRAGVASAPQFATGDFEGGRQRFADTLSEQDARAGQMRRDFPGVYNTGAVTGAVAGGLLLPIGKGRAAQVGINALTGGAGGFLSTDGTVGERAVGAGLGAGLGAAGAFIPMPRIAGQRAVTNEQVAAAESVFRDMGLSPGEIPQYSIEVLQRELTRGSDPRDAAILALNAGLPTPIPLNRGNVTGLPTDQFNFNAALRGAGGDQPAELAQQMVASQQDAMQGNIAQIAQRIAGDAPVLPTSRGAETAAEALVAQRRAAKRGVDEAYAAAREMGESAMLDRGTDLRAAMLDNLRDFSPEDIESVVRIVDNFGSEGATTARQIFDARARLTNLRQAGGINGAAAGKAVNALDASVTQAMADDLILGDPAAINQWKTAIAKNAEYAGIFKSGDLVDRLTAEVGFGSNRQLAIDPGDAANLIFGRSALGMVGKRNLYRDLEKVRTLLGEDSDGWNQLRAEAFMRFANAGQTTAEGGVPQFTGRGMQSAWEKAKREDMRLIETLFSRPERDLIDNFTTMATRVTSPVKGGDNPSNSAIAAGRLLGNLASSSFAVGKLIPFINVTLLEMEKIAKGATARAALKPSPRRPGSTAATRQLSGRAGAAAGSGIAQPRSSTEP